MTDSEINTDSLEPDTLHVEDGALDQLVSFFRTGTMAIPSGTDPRIEAHRLVIDVDETALEITASDDTVEIREVPDE